MGEGFTKLHIIVTMCDVGGGGKNGTVTSHVTFMARLSQGVRE